MPDVPFFYFIGSGDVGGGGGGCGSDIGSGDCEIRRRWKGIYRQGGKEGNEEKGLNEDDDKDDEGYDKSAKMRRKVRNK